VRRYLKTGCDALFASGAMTRFQWRTNFSYNDQWSVFENDLQRPMAPTFTFVFDTAVIIATEVDWTGAYHGGSHNRVIVVEVVGLAQDGSRLG